jgi:protein ImuB
MTRIACAWIPRFELALVARREGPSLWGRPVVIADLAESPALIREATPAAERAGVRPGMTVAQAAARCGELLTRPPLPDARAAAEREALAALAAHAPQLASDGRGAFFLGLAGMGRLLVDERGFAARVRASLEALGFAARVALAGHPFAAWVAARRNLGPVAPGADARLLASVPLAELELPAAARDLLELLGVTAAGQLARLPRGALARRLGPEGERLDRLCRGEWLAPGTAPTAANVPRAPADAARDLETAVEGLEPVLFLVKSLLDALLARVAAERMALAELTVEAELEDAGRTRVAHTLAPAEPTLDARPLVDLVRLWLERAPFPAPPRALRVVASRLAPAVARQLRLHARRQDEGEAALGRALARLEAAFGAGSVVRPTLAARYLPEERVAWAAASVAGMRPAKREAPSAAPGVCCPGDRPRRAAPEVRCHEYPGLPLALRLLSTPEPVELAGGGGAPQRLLRKGYPPRRVLRVEAAQRRSGEWWDAPFDRSYAWVVCEGGGGGVERYWLFHDHLCGGTFLQAVAD